MRYENKDIESIWSERSSVASRLNVELTWLRSLEYVRMVDHPVTGLSDCEIDEIIETAKVLEEKSQHDVAAMVIALERVLKKKGYKDHKMVHYGLTSSDICDTSLSLLYRSSFRLINYRLIELTKYPVDLDNVKIPSRTHGVDTGIQIPLSLRIARINEELRMVGEEIHNLKFYGKLSGPIGLADGFENHEVCELTALSLLKLNRHQGSTQVIPRQVYADYHFKIATIGKILSKLATGIRLAILAGDISLERRENEIGSSSMPHKINPWRLERVVGMSRMLDSHVSVALSNIDLWLERDISHSCSERVNPKNGFNYLMVMMDDIIDTLKRVSHARERKEVPTSYYALNRLIMGGESREECHKTVESSS